MNAALMMVTKLDVSNFKRPFEMVDDGGEDSANSTDPFYLSLLY